MKDCSPVYLLVYENQELVARAALWLVRNEPLPPALPKPLRSMAAALLHRWPLLICRSPMANASGLILPADARRTTVLSMLSEAAVREGKQRGASLVVFDFLNESESSDWPASFITSKLPNAGTVMENRWQTMDEYLAHGDKKDRQHYKRSLREAEKRGIRLTRTARASDPQAALHLIENVERRNGSSPNPWMRNTLENIGMVEGTWLEAHIDQRLVGCGLILEDNHAQMTTALGLAEDEPYVYFLLVYASLEAAFEKHVRLLRWGTGAYEVKHRLGFELEEDNFLKHRGTNRLTNLMSQLAA